MLTTAQASKAIAESVAEFEAEEVALAHGRGQQAAEQFLESHVGDHVADAPNQEHVRG